MVVVIVFIIDLTLTAELNNRMSNPEFVAQNAINHFRKFCSLTDHHIFCIDMGAHRVHPGGNRPDMNIMHIINSGNLPEALGYFININLSRSSLQ